MHEFHPNEEFETSVENIHISLSPAPSSTNDPSTPVDFSKGIKILMSDSTTKSHLARSKSPFQHESNLTLGNIFINQQPKEITANDILLEC